MNNIVYLNGNYTEAKNATISIFDRGLLFGDSIYEVIPVYNGTPCFVDRHLQRLNSNLDKIKIQKPDLDWLSIINQLIQLNGKSDMQIYLQVTRGNQGVRKHDIPKDIDPFSFAFTMHTAYSSDEEKRRGLSASIIDDTRWLRCDIKATTLLSNVLLNDEAVCAGDQTALLVRNGFLTEGTVSNVFIVDDKGTIKTPPLSNYCLPGITRQLVIELIKELNLPFSEEAIPEADILSAQEVMITSTSKEIYPVTQVNQQKIGNGVGGPCWEKLNTNFHKLVESCYDR